MSERPTMEDLRYAYMHQACCCTGACMVDGVAGPCPTGPADKSFPGFLRYLIDLEEKVSAAFGSPLNQARIDIITAALAAAEQREVTATG